MIFPFDSPEAWWDLWRRQGAMGRYLLRCPWANWYLVGAVGCSPSKAISGGSLRERRFSPITQGSQSKERGEYMSTVPMKGSGVTLLGLLDGFLVAQVRLPCCGKYPRTFQKWTKLFDTSSEFWDNLGSRCRGRQVCFSLCSYEAPQGLWKDSAVWGKLLEGRGRSEDCRCLLELSSDGEGFFGRSFSVHSKGFGESEGAPRGKRPNREWSSLVWTGGTPCRPVYLGFVRRNRKKCTFDFFLPPIFLQHGQFWVAELETTMKRCSWEWYESKTHQSCEDTIFGCNCWWRRLFVFPQIAGSYRGSYFSKVGLLITEIAAAPSLPSSFVSLHLSPCTLITEIAAAPSLPSSFVSLHLSPCTLITEIAAAPSLPSSFKPLGTDVDKATLLWLHGP